MKYKNIKAQLKRAVADHTRSGVSKRTDRLNHVNTHLYIYANSAYHDQKAFANAFGGWMMQEHPEIRKVTDITKEHMLEYLNSHINEWSSGTYNKNLTFAGKMAAMVADTYNCHTDWTNGIERAKPASGSIKEYRTVCATAPELSQIRQDAKRPSAGEGIKAAVFGSFFGLRAGSISSIQIDDLHNDHIHIRQDKGGRPRDIKITTREQKAAVQAALRHAETHRRCGSDTVFNVTTAGIEKAVGRCIQRYGLNSLADAKTGMHALRKSYARQRYESIYASRHNGQSPYKDAVGHTRHALDARDPAERVEYDRVAWNLVNEELGHGRDRTELFAVYITNTQG